MNPPHTHTILPALFGFLLGASVGALGFRLLLDPVPPPAPVVPTTSNDDVVAVLRELAGELRKLREATETSSPSEPREAVASRAPMDAPASDRLESAIERLAEVLAAPGSAVQPRRRAEAGPARDPLRPKATDRLLALCKLSEAERGRACYFLSLQEFLDAYGSPDYIDVQGNAGTLLRLRYKVEEEETIDFGFSHDLLYSIDCNG